MRADNFFVLQQQQNLWRRFGTSKMHLSPQVALTAVPSKTVVLLLFLFIVTPIVGVRNFLCFVVHILCPAYLCILHNKNNKIIK